MLGWLFARSPLDPAEKAWIEVHMLRLTEKLGTSQLLAKPLTTLDDLVGVDYTASAEGAQAMLQRLCDTARLPVDSYPLTVVNDDCCSDLPTANLSELPASERQPMTFAVSQLAHPAVAAAALAREIAARLFPTLSQSRTGVGPEGWLADLTAICLGWGPILGHAAAEASAGGGSCGCGPSRPNPGLPPRLMGYALGLVAHVRGEPRPAWRDTLRLDSQAIFDRSLRYLHRSSDTLFQLESAGKPIRVRATPDVLLQLNRGSRSAQIAALWELRDPCHAELGAEAVGRYLHDSLPVIRQTAALTLSAYGTAARELVDSLLELSEEPRPEVRSAAATALGTAGVDQEEVLHRLATLMRDSDREVVHQAAIALERFGEKGASAVPQVLEGLRNAMIRCDHPLIDTVTRTLYALDPDPTDAVLEHFEDDPELREQVVHVIVDALKEQDEGSLA